MRRLPPPVPHPSAATAGSPHAVGGWAGRPAACEPRSVPWDSPNVAKLQLTRDGGLRAVHTLTGKRQMLQEAAPSDMALVARPGSRHQDVVIVDDRKSALQALGR